MTRIVKPETFSIPAKHFICILFFTAITVNFLITLSNPLLDFAFNNYLPAAILIFLSFGVIFFTWLGLSLYFAKKGGYPHSYSSLVISPLILLLFWKPQENNLNLLLPLITILLTQAVFFLLLSRPEPLTGLGEGKQKIILALFITAYFIIISWIMIQKYLNFSLFNPKDFAIYNQTFWNTINGRFFENSTYGSNFACHNSVFFIFLVPFYYLVPHPLTLALLRTLLLALSAIPFYLSAKAILKNASVLPLTLAFIAYPFLISQNFNAVHEIGYSVFFILFTFYFFLKKKFLPFVIFLLLTVSIKEHLSAMALMFGLYAFFSKRSRKWIIFPVLLGIFWALFSWSIISYFQGVYHSHPDSAWFLTSLKRRAGQHQLFSVLSSSNLANWHNLKFSLLLITPLGIIPPLLSALSLLGLPELLINLLSDSGRPAIFSPLWHYNIMVACFLLIATAAGIKKIADSKQLQKIGVEKTVACFLISLLVLSSTVIHSYLWVRMTDWQTDNPAVKAYREALPLIPKNASLSIPQNIAVHVSARKDYYLTGDSRCGDYILDHKNSATYLSLLKGKKIKGFTELFNKEGVVLLKKNLRNLNLVLQP